MVQEIIKRFIISRSNDYLVFLKNGFLKVSCITMQLLQLVLTFFKKVRLKNNFS